MEKLAMLYQTLDDKILIWIQNNLRNDIWNLIFSTFTHLGDHGEIWIALILLLLFMPKYKKIGITTLFSLSISFLLVDFVIKPYVRRIRPYEVVEGLKCLVGRESSFSFPSGHSATSLAVGYVLLRTLPKFYGISGFVLAVLMAFSRIYVGVHYPSDVVVGGILGIIIGEVCIRLESFWNKSK